MASLRRGKRNGFTLVEVLTVTVVIAILMGMGFMLLRGMRKAARVATAESRMRQISTGMELYFRKFHCYPPEGSDLAQVLAPFIDDPEVFRNPLLDEKVPGETISALYRLRSLSEIDRPDYYVTAMISGNGKTAVIMRTGNKIQRREDLDYDPNAPAGDLIAMLDPEAADLGGGGDGGAGEDPPPEGAGEEPPPEGGTVEDPPPPEGGGGEPAAQGNTGKLLGHINLNPSNNPDYDFVLVKADGTTLTRDTLKDLKGATGDVYDGPATSVRFTPKGSGNQSSLTLNGEAYAVDNAATYLIDNVEGTMSVRVYNAMDPATGLGHWWAEITMVAPSTATISAQ